MHSYKADSHHWEQYMRQSVCVSTQPRVYFIHLANLSFGRHLQTAKGARTLRRLVPTLVLQRKHGDVREVHLRRLRREREQLRDEGGLQKDVSGQVSAAPV